MCSSWTPRAPAAADLPLDAERLVVPLGRPASEAASADSNRGLLRSRAAGPRRSGRSTRRIPLSLDADVLPRAWGADRRGPARHDRRGSSGPDVSEPAQPILWGLKQRVAMRTAARLFTVSAASRAAVAHRAGIDSADSPSCRRHLTPCSTLGRPRRWHESCCGSASTASVASSSTPGASARTRTSRRCSTLTPGRVRADAATAARARGRPRARDLCLCCGRDPQSDRRARDRSTTSCCPGSSPTTRSPASTRRRPRSRCRLLRKASGCPRSRLRPAVRCAAQRLARAPRVARRRRSLLRRSGRGCAGRGSRDDARRRGGADGTRDRGTSSSRRAHLGRGGRTASRSPARGGGPVSGPSLSFCMVTTFYPPHHFGGDATYVYRLSNELARARSSGHRRVQPRRVSHPRRGAGVRALEARERGRSSAAEPTDRARPARHLPEWTAGPAGTRAPAALRAGALRRRPLPQRLARRRPRRPRLRRRHQALHDPRALARLPDAHALAARPRDLRAADLPSLHARVPPSAAALALRLAARAERARSRSLPLAESVHDRDASTARLRPADAAPAVLHSGDPRAADSLR